MTQENIDALIFRGLKHHLDWSSNNLSLEALYMFSFETRVSIISMSQLNSHQENRSKDVHYAIAVKEIYTPLFCTCFHHVNCWVEIQTKQSG